MVNIDSKTNKMVLAGQLAEKSSHEQLDTCVNAAVNGQPGNCGLSGSQEDILQVLSKADFMRSKIDAGMTPQLAMRDLAARMRKLQGG